MSTYIIYQLKLKLTNPDNEAFVIGNDWEINGENIICKSLLFRHFTEDELRHSIQDLQFEVRKHKNVRICGKIISFHKVDDDILMDKWGINNSRIVVQSSVSGLEEEMKGMKGTITDIHKLLLTSLKSGNQPLNKE